MNLKNKIYGGVFMPSEKDKVELHRELLLLLKKFDEVCRENDIKYSLHGGTLLGAIREKGFIPWDDDADVTLTRDNFEKLCGIMRQEHIHSEIVLDEYSKYMPAVWMRRNGKPPVWIDLLVYDYISESLIFQKLKYVGLVFFLGFTKNKEEIEVTRIGEYRGIKFYIAYILYILGKPFSNYLKTKLKYVFSKYFFVGSKQYMIRGNDQYKALKMVVSSESIINYMYVPFENIHLMVHTGYDEILRSSYGNEYMIPVRPTELHARAHEMRR